MDFAPTGKKREYHNLSNYLNDIQQHIKMEKYNPKIHHRRSIRLKGYDYSQAGLYFVTICCQNKEHLFGKIDNGIMALNDAGKIIEKIWREIPNDFTNIHLHEYTTMPNHIHGIIEIIAKNAGINEIPELSQIIQSFKRHTTIEYREPLKTRNLIEVQG